MLKSMILVAAVLLASHAGAASLASSPATLAGPAASGQYCSWGTGIYSNGTRMCVSNARVMICVSGEWRVDETRTPFTEDVCRQDNPRAPVFGK